MILQRQYSLWKSVNIIFIVWIVIMFLFIIFFKYRIYSLNNDIWKKSIDISKLDEKISIYKEKYVYKKYEMANIILSKENNTNYVALYQYLNKIKNDLFKTMKDAKQKWFSRFKLVVNKWDISIDTAVPDYKYLYNNTWWLYTLLENKSFITKINVNSYKTQNNMIYFNVKLKTK